MIRPFPPHVPRCCVLDFDLEMPDSTNGCPRSQGLGSGIFVSLVKKSLFAYLHTVLTTLATKQGLGSRLRSTYCPQPSCAGTVGQVAKRPEETPGDRQFIRKCCGEGPKQFHFSQCLSLRMRRQPQPHTGLWPVTAGRFLGHRSSDTTSLACLGPASHGPGWHAREQHCTDSTVPPQVPGCTETARVLQGQRDWHALAQTCSGGSLDVDRLLAAEAGTAGTCCLTVPLFSKDNTMSNSVRLKQAVL